MQSKTYSTSQIAKLFCLHPNTIMLYEKWGVISIAQRKENGYRIFTEEHIKQIEIIRLALKTEIIQNGLRKQAINIIKTMAKRDYSLAYMLTDKFILNIKNEIVLSEEAIVIIENILKNNLNETGLITYKRQQAADVLHITIDTLRNWELNGLLKVKRKENGYRIYTERDMKMLKVIRVLRAANYSLSSILRMINAFNINHDTDIKKILNKPENGEFIVSVCDKLLTSLKTLQKDAEKIKEKIVQF